MAEHEIFEEEITEESAQKALNEVMDGERIVDIDGFGKVCIRLPSTKLKKEADMVYSTTFSELIESNLKTTVEMEKILRDRGIWTEEKERKISELEQEIRGQSLLLSTAKTDKRKKEIREKISELRREMRSLQSEKHSFLQNTVESKAEDARISYLLYNCVTDAETGKPLWSSFEEFENEPNEEAFLRLFTEFVLFANGLPSNILDLLPGDSDDVVTDSKEE